MKCPRCLNEDPLYFYEDGGGWYCRKCIMFGRIDINQELKTKPYICKKHHVHYQLTYTLTNYQQNVVKKLNELLAQSQDVLVYAATGAGKTEIVMQSIEDYLNNKKKVGIAISRRQVVLEIKERMQKAFPTLHVVAVCEGFTTETDGDLIVCTMHQLYRYHQTFDLLIMDEVDAFPYRGNTVLENIAKHSCKGEMIYLSATPDELMLTSVKEHKLAMVSLFKRPHGFPLCVPQVWVMPFFFQPIFLQISLFFSKKKGKPMLVFVPTIRMANVLYRILSVFFNCNVITSKSINKDEITMKMRDGTYDFLIATTILERGITIPNIDVIVLSCEHIVFNEASLIQIAGRVGRSMSCPSGHCYFLCTHKNKEIKKCIQSIRNMNEEESCDIV